MVERSSGWSHFSVSTRLFREHSSGPIMSDALARVDIPLLLIVEKARTLLPSSLIHDVLMVPFAAYQIVNYFVLSFSGKESTCLN
jgi:hypothetical protein